MTSRSYLQNVCLHLKITNDINGFDKNHFSILTRPSVLNIEGIPFGSFSFMKFTKVHTASFRTESG